GIDDGDTSGEIERPYVLRTCDQRCVPQEREVVGARGDEVAAAVDGSGKIDERKSACCVGDRAELERRQTLVLARGRDSEAGNRASPSRSRGAVLNDPGNRPRSRIRRADDVDPAGRVRDRGVPERAPVRVDVAGRGESRRPGCRRLTGSCPGAIRNDSRRRSRVPYPDRLTRRRQRRANELRPLSRSMRRSGRRAPPNRQGTTARRGALDTTSLPCRRRTWRTQTRGIVPPARLTER